MSMLGEVPHQLSCDPIVTREPPARRREIAQQAFARPLDDCRLQRWAGRRGVVPIAVSSDPLIATTATTLEPGGKVGAADLLEVALSLARAAEDVEGLGGGRQPRGRLRTGRRAAERDQRDTEIGE
jgi:hypothetical protein